MDIYLLNRVKTKKIVFTAIWHYIWPELVGIIRAKTGTFSSDYSALKSRYGQTLNVDEGTLILDGVSPPYPLQFKYCLYPY